MIKRAFENINMFNALIVISILNILDAILTVLWIQQGIATESNPIMEEALSHGVFNFFLIKFCLVSIGCLGLWRARNNIASKVAAFLCVSCYGVLLFYHMIGFYIGFVQ